MGQGSYGLEGGYGEFGQQQRRLGGGEGSDAKPDQPVGGVCEDLVDSRQGERAQLAEGGLEIAADKRVEGALGLGVELPGESDDESGIDEAGSGCQGGEGQLYRGQCDVGLRRGYRYADALPIDLLPPRWERPSCRDPCHRPDQRGLPDFFRAKTAGLWRVAQKRQAKAS